MTITTTVDNPIPEQPVRILLVEDDELNAFQITRRIRHKIGEPLKKSGRILEIIVVSTMREALLHSQTVNATILDLGLPDSDPEDTISCIEKFRPPVIVITGYDDEDLHARCRMAGATSVFVKGQLHGLCLAVTESVTRDVLRTNGMMLEHAQ